MICERLLQPIRYVSIGIFNTGLSYLAFALLVSLHCNASIANVLSYFLGMTSSFWLNATWTFGRKPSIRYVARFLLVNTMVMAISTLTLHIIMHLSMTSPYIGQAVNLIPTTLIGFIANKRIVFRDQTNEDIEQIFRFSVISMVIVACQRSLIFLYQIWIEHGLGRSWNWYALMVRGVTRWDSGWYLAISTHGYQQLKQTAFWPAYPVAMKVIHFLTGFPLAACGVGISLVCFASGVFFLGLVVHRQFDQRTAIRSMVLLAAFPTSFYFDAVYTESMFLALFMAAVYASSHRRFWLAGILGACATLTHDTGFLVAIFMVVDYLSSRNVPITFWRIPWWKRMDWHIISMAVPLVSLLAYCDWLHIRFNHFFAFLVAEKAWHRSYMAPWKTFYNSVGLLTHPYSTILPVWYLRLELGAFIFLVLSLAIGLPSVRRSPVQLAWWLYLLAYTWITTTEPSMNIPDYLVSDSRYALMAFPAFVYVSRFVRPSWLFYSFVTLLCMEMVNKSGQFFLVNWIA